MEGVDVIVCFIFVGVVVVVVVVVVTAEEHESVLRTAGTIETGKIIQLVFCLGGVKHFHQISMEVKGRTADLFLFLRSLSSLFPSSLIFPVSE